MVRSADRVITCSRYMRSHVATVFVARPSEIAVIPNGIDPRDLEPSSRADLGALRARYAPPRGACWCCSSAGWSTRRASTSRSTRSRP